MIDITEYRLPSNKVPKDICVALLTDLHARTDKRIIKILNEKKPDIITIAGDFANVKKKYADRTKAYAQDIYLKDAPTPAWIAEPWTIKKYNPGLMEYLSEISRIAPTYLSLGNHEWPVGKEEYAYISDMGIHILDNIFEEISDLSIMIGGITSAEVMLIRGFVKDYGYPEYEWRHDHFEHTDALEIKWLKEFREKDGFKLLLCHHPEYMVREDPAVKLEGVDLALAGHAHGGQVRFGKKRLYAPGQGLFPKYTEGMIDINGSKIVISRGLANTYMLPRINNRPEVVFIYVSP